MTSTIVKTVVDELFAALSTRFAANPMVSLLLNVLHAAADGLIDQVTANTSSKMVEPKP